MSWNKITVEGRVMWERSDGTRLRTGEEIAALEKYESEQLSSRWERSNERYSDSLYDDADPNEDVSHVEGIGVPLVIMIVFLLAAYFWPLLSA